MKSSIIMTDKKNIALTGMPGSGKTTAAIELSKILSDFLCIDIDEEIEKYTGSKISEIFRQHSEEYFRKIECETIKKIFQGEKLIIALGGGAFENSENRAVIAKSAYTVYLKTSPEVIFNRIKNETHRPLLKEDFSIKKISEILEKRGINYEKADITIYTDNKTPADIIKEILEVLNDLP